MLGKIKNMLERQNSREPLEDRVVKVAYRSIPFYLLGEIGTTVVSTMMGKSGTPPLIRYLTEGINPFDISSTYYALPEVLDPLEMALVLGLPASYWAFDVFDAWASRHKYWGFPSPFG